MHGNVPVRFGRGRLDSRGNKGLAAYLIAADLRLRRPVDQTAARHAKRRIALGVSDRRANGGSGKGRFRRG
jgi:hypothetical protein